MSSLVSLIAAFVVPSRPSVAKILEAWSLGPLVVIPIAVAGWLYAAGIRKVRAKYPRSPWPGRRARWFFGGLALVFLVLASPIDVYAEVFLWVHMVQHITLMMIAPPMLLLGAPITLALRASSPRVRRSVLLPVLRSPPVKVLSFPVVSWALFAAAVVGTHFSPMYEAALQNQWVHAVEHAIYIGSGLLFWWPVVGLDPSPWRMPHPARLLYVFMSAPVSTFTALAIFSADHVLYPHYLLVARTWGPSPLTDQHWGGALMWISGDGILLASVTLVALGWMRHDRIATARIDARLDREREASERAQFLRRG